MIHVVKTKKVVQHIIYTYLNRLRTFIVIFYLFYIDEWKRWHYNSFTVNSNTKSGQWRPIGARPFTKNLSASFEFTVMSHGVWHTPRPYSLRLFSANNFSVEEWVLLGHIRMYEWQFNMPRLIARRDTLCGNMASTWNSLCGLFSREIVVSRQ